MIFTGLILSAGKIVIEFIVFSIPKPISSNFAKTASKCSGSTFVILSLVLVIAPASIFYKYSKILWYIGDFWLVALLDICCIKKIE